MCAFYVFAKRKGWVKTLPYEYEERQVIQSGGFPAHVGASDSKQAVQSVMPRKHRDLIKFLSRDQLKALLAAADNPHHHTMIRFAVQSGLRREELASFPLAYVIDPDKTGGVERNVRLNLDPADGTGMKTKGSKPRTIYEMQRPCSVIIRTTSSLKLGSKLRRCLVM